MSSDPKPSPVSLKIDLYRPTSVSGLRKLAYTPQVARGFLDAMPSSLRAEKNSFVQAMLTEASATPELLDCTPISLFTCVIRSAQLGLKVGGPAGQAYIVPYRNRQKGVSEAQLQIGYKGYIQMIQRTDLVRRITPVTVREGDRFSYELGTEPRIVHRPEGGEDREGVVFYVVVERTNGGIDFEVFTREDALRHRSRYVKKTSGPWFDMTNGGGFERMAEKTLIRRIAKRLPLSDQFVRAVEFDDQAEAGEPQDHSDVEAVIVGAVEVDPPPAPEPPEDDASMLGRD